MFRKIFQIGILNTVRMNLYYFGWKGVLHAYIIASRSLKITELKGVIQYDGAKIYTGCIKIGFTHVAIFDQRYERSIWHNSGNIYVKGKVVLGQGTRIANSGELYFGNDFTTTAKCNIICEKKISFGDDVLISWDTLFMDNDFHKIFNKDGDTVVNQPKSIAVGNHVWIGCNTKVLKGSVIPNNSVVAAGSLITHELRDENTVISNNLILKKDIDWER